MKFKKDDECEIKESEPKIEGPETEGEVFLEMMEKDWTSDPTEELCVLIGEELRREIDREIIEALKLLKTNDKII